MSDGRKRLSGSEYKKRAKEKEEKNKIVLSKVPKLDHFFKSSSRIRDDNAILSNNLQVPQAGTSETCNSETNPTRHQPVLEVETATNETIDPVESTNIEKKGESVESQNDNGFFASDSDKISSDPFLWQLDNATRDYLSIHGFTQNIDCDFTKSKRDYKNYSRYFSKSMFERKLHNGEKKLRNWLIYSETTGSVFCGPCLLFNGGSQFGADEGFNDWKNSRRIEEHENSDSHKDCVLALRSRRNILNSIDSQLTEQVDDEIKYWRNILRRVVSIVKTLASRGLPFRGHTEKLGCTQNGNFLMSLELLAEYDTCLAEHISRYGNPGKGHTTYLSSTTCDEFIDLMAHEVHEIIYEEVRNSKYFSIVVDSTPDSSHVDQLTFVLRYVKPDGNPVERFLEFLPNVGHKGIEIAEAVLLTLKNAKLDIMNCRGQSYDNASNMSGIYNGVQAKIKEICPLADYVPCSAHSLNLVGACAAEICQESCKFFNILQELYNLFSLSTQRWEILQNQCDLYKKQCEENKDLLSDSRKTDKRKTVKSLSSTRWSARHDACESLFQLWNPVHDALHHIENDQLQKPVIRCQAKGIRQELERLETAFMTCFWEFLLNRINSVSKQLQKETIDIVSTVSLYDSLIELVREFRRDNSFDNFEKQALELSYSKEYERNVKRQRKRKQHHDETPSEEVSVSARDHFRINVYNVILDNLLGELQKRRESYKTLVDKFGFLLKLQNLDIDEITVKARHLISSYPDDLEENFVKECIHFRGHCISEYQREIATQSSKDSENENKEKKETLILLTWLKENELNSVYPNIDIALRMCVCMATSNCSAERSFSTLKRTKNYLRTNTSQHKLNALALLNIESEILKGINFDHIIDVFAEKKCRRKRL